MGFDEEDFDVLMDNNIMMGKSRPLFSMGKLIKMAGNSIVVNVLEAIFMQVDEINKKILGE
jgi:DNA (cytosine-5)-methyltransferase 1